MKDELGLLYIECIQSSISPQGASNDKVVKTIAFNTAKYLKEYLETETLNRYLSCIKVYFYSTGIFFFISPVSLVSHSNIYTLLEKSMEDRIYETKLGKTSYMFNMVFSTHPITDYSDLDSLIVEIYNKENRL